MSAYPRIEADESELTDDERRAIASLQRLGTRWPQTLKLVSMDGALSVIHANDPRFESEHRHAGERQECILAHIDGIPNDGGAW
jgi:hypothetical protein